VVVVIPRLLRALLATSAALLIVLSCRRAAAGDAESELLGYYGGERFSAYLIGSIGLAAAGGGAYLVTRPGSFARGLGWSFVAMGGLEAIGGVVYVVEVNTEIGRYEALLKSDPARYRAEEIVHIRGTASRFIFYRLTELAFVAGGAAAAIYGFAANQDTWKGIGIGVAGLALPLTVIDTVNNARAASYLRSLETAASAVQVVPTSGGVALAVSGRF
jgi:hypothetical protein